MILDYEFKRLVNCNSGGQILLYVNDGLGRVSNGSVFLLSELCISAMYGRNFKPKIFSDITMPAKQSYSPNSGDESTI